MPKGHYDRSKMNVTKRLGRPPGKPSKTAAAIRKEKVAVLDRAIARSRAAAPRAAAGGPAKASQLARKTKAPARRAPKAAGIAAADVSLMSAVIALQAVVQQMAASMNHNCQILQNRMAGMEAMLRGPQMALPAKIEPQPEHGFMKSNGELDGKPLRSLDPDGLSSAKHDVMT